MRKIIDGKGETKNNANRGDQDAIRRARKAAQRPTHAVVRKMAPTSVGITTVVKTIRAYDAVDYVVAVAFGNPAITGLTFGSPAEIVARKVIRYYQTAETLAGTHQARLMLTQERFSHSYPAPQPSYRLGYDRAMQALHVGAMNAEHLRRREIARAQSDINVAQAMFVEYKQRKVTKRTQKCSAVVATRVASAMLQPA